MPAWKPAYLIHGDDHARIAARRSGFRAAAEREGGASGLEVLEGETATAEAVAAALAAMTFAVGRRFILVDGAEQLKEQDVQAHLAPALATVPPDTTVALFAREDGRRKVAKALVEAVHAAGGDVAAHATLKAKELPAWAQAHARRLGLELDGAGARSLVGHTGPRQQRIERELEKLLLEHGRGASLGADEVDASCGGAAERQVWDLTDALVALDARLALRRYLELAEQGEQVGRLVASMTPRVRETLAIALRLEAGESPAEIKRSTKGSPWAVDHRIREARAAGVDPLRELVELAAGLELDVRGMSDLREDTAIVGALAALA